MIHSLSDGLSPADYYPAFLDMVRQVLDGNMDGVAYEDTLREMFGIHAFPAFTLDKVIANAVRQLQYLVTDDACLDCWDLHVSERRAEGTGGAVSTSGSRFFNELMYQKKAEKILADENCFKIVVYRESGQLTVELLDTESESRNGSEEEAEEEDKVRVSQQNVERFLAPGETVSQETKSHLVQKPVFLARSVRSYRRKTRHRLVPRPENLPEKQPQTGKHRNDSLNLADDSIVFEDNTACSFNPKNFKILWVVNSENCIYKSNSLLKAKQVNITSLRFTLVLLNNFTFIAFFLSSNMHDLIKMEFFFL